MRPILANYRLLIRKYRKIENDSSENEIHDKRVILRRIFPILRAYKIDPSDLKNGEKAFNLFGKLRDIQVQILTLESNVVSADLAEYQAYLKGRETKLKKQVQRFCKKKKLEFPIIPKKSSLDKADILKSAGKSLTKLIKRVETRDMDSIRDIHKIRIEFKKFRYHVEMLSYVSAIDEAKLDRLKLFQDKLGEIQDYQVLIDGIRKYDQKHNMVTAGITDGFEIIQKNLFDNFNTQIDLFTEACRDVLRFN